MTLDRLESFDKNFVAFGRVIEGFDLFKRINSEQSENSLHPTVNLKIVSAEFYTKKLPSKLVYSLTDKLAEELDKSVKHASLTKNCEEHVYFENISELMMFAEEYNPATVNLGPKIIELSYLTEYDDLAALRKMNLFNVRQKFARFKLSDRHSHFQKLQSEL